MYFSQFIATEFAFKTSYTMKKPHHGRPFCRLKRLIEQEKRHPAPPMSLANLSDVVIQYTTRTRNRGGYPRVCATPIERCQPPARKKNTSPMQNSSRAAMMAMRTHSSHCSLNMSSSCGKSSARRFTRHPMPRISAMISIKTPSRKKSSLRAPDLQNRLELGTATRSSFRKLPRTPRRARNENLPRRMRCTFQETGNRPC